MGSLNGNPTPIGLDFGKTASSHASWANDGLVDEALQWRMLSALSFRATGVTNAGIKKIGEFSELRTLDLSCTRVTEDCFPNLLQLKKLTTLELEEVAISDNGLNYLSKHFKQMQRLNVRRTGLADRHLAAIGRLPEIVDLELEDDGITDEKIGELTGLKKVGKLFLSSASVHGEGVDKLAICTGLRELNLGFSPITDRGLKAIGAINSLQVLQIDGAALSAAGFDAFKGQNLISFSCWGAKNEVGDKMSAVIVKECPSLRELDLGSSRLTHVGLAHLKKARSLRSLYILGSPLGKKEISEIAHIGTLTKLWIVKTGVSKWAIEMLAKSPLRLEALNLAENPIEDEACEALMEMKTLMELNLSSTIITDGGIPVLAKLSSLKRLCLFNTMITDRHIGELAKLDLEELDLGNTQVTEFSFNHLRRCGRLRLLILPVRASVELEKLRRDLPNCRIIAGG